MIKKSTQKTEVNSFWCINLALQNDSPSVAMAQMNANGNATSVWKSLIMNLMVLAFFFTGFFASAQTITIDGNPSDWPAVLNSTAAIKGRIPDPINNTDDIWTGGSKDIQQISQWVWSTNSANDKNNIANVGYYLQGSVFYFFADRHANNGDSAIGFWILQSPVGKVGTTGGSFSGVHQNGDVLLISNFSNGGTNAAISAYVWQNGALNTTPTLLPTAGLVAKVNSASVPSPQGWGYMPKGGVVGDNYKTNTFFEGKVDLGLLNTDLNACLGTFLVETRNSTSLTAALEDVVTNPLAIVPTCDILGDANVCPNSTVTFSAPLGVTYTWSVTGTGATIVGSTTSQTVTLNTSNCGSSFELSLILTNQTGCETGCSRIIAVQDTTNPTITVAATSQTVECDGDGNTASLAAWLASNGGATATDNCAFVWSNNYTGLSDGCGATGSVTVTFTATDGCGNVGQTTATFTIVDTTNPSITTQASNQTVECDGAGNAAALAAWLASNGGAVASDVCSGGVTWSNNFTALSDLCGATGAATVIFKATDACNNFSTTTATFTIVDTTNPSITPASSDLTVDCDGSGNTLALQAWLASNGGASATDACSGVTWTNNFVEFVGTCGSVMVTFTATDDCDNFAITTSTFTINPIVIVPVCPGNMTAIDCETAGMAEFATWISSFGYTGGCGDITETDLSGYLFPEPGQSVTIIYTVSDECAQVVSCTATFTAPDCYDGCTLGYWKNQPENWCSAYTTTQLYGSVFTSAPTSIASLTLMQALNIEGGGMYNLVRQSVAALLNICHEDVNYSSPYLDNVSLLIADVNAAFVVGGSAPGALGSALDILNNEGCSIDAHGDVIEIAAAKTTETTTTVSTLENSLFVVHPVPFKDNINVIYSFDYQSAVTIEVFDYMGVLVNRFNDNSAYLNKEINLSMNLSSLRGQVFVIRVTTDRETSSQVIVKAKN